ncbi:voltage-gated potassium channel [Sistotremastrum suecicum HHB10207 ss-3]|uniref:Voltage-gated potassium channel n=1 Tax=Sistotremastrum suecicum HHB10207 ss-3 TaxID=1314776 RepID=A0A166D8U7_9AGAM|nr:voltage-gated potassium channel [Sistotremastrum suecicum HHB10207 ss-3]
MTSRPIRLSAITTSAHFLTETRDLPPDSGDETSSLYGLRPSSVPAALKEVKPTWRRDLHALLEYPTSSSSAFVVHILITGLIVFSGVITIIETLPPFTHLNLRLWFGIETSLVALFTVEYIARCLAWSTDFKTFFSWFRSFFAVVDLLAILPYYIEIAIRADTTSFFRFSILRTFRLLRVFRPFRYSSTILLTIEVMFLSFKRSKDALLALAFFIVMALVVFSTLIYFAERGTWDPNLEVFINVDGDPTQFESIPAAAWFVLVTITTVGYGEIVPRSFLGRLFTLPLLLFGLLLIALPSFVLGREFSLIWETMSHEQQPEDIDGARLADTVQQERDLSNRKLAQNQREISHQIETIRNDLTLLTRELRELMDAQRAIGSEKKE